MMSSFNILIFLYMLRPIVCVPRKMQVSGATDLASKGQVLSDSSNVKFKEELEDSYNDMKIRCPCGSALPNETMLKVLPNILFFFPFVQVGLPFRWLYTFAYWTHETVV